MKLLIDTEWATFISDLSEEKQLEFFWAVFDYGNRECNLNCWNKIKPLLESGKIKYYNRLNNLKQFNTESDTESDSESEPEREPEREYKYEYNKNMGVNNKGVIGGKEKGGEEIQGCVVNSWNVIARKYGLAEIKGLSETRKSKFKRRFKQAGVKTIEEFFKIIDSAINDSLFLQGKEQVFESGEWVFTDRDWRADFDFFMQEKSFTKVLESGYDDAIIRKMKEERKENATKDTDMPVSD